MKHLIGFERNLTSENIAETIKTYTTLLESLKVESFSENIIGFLHNLKRKKLENGPYREVSLFEAANRIMTDLVILYGIKAMIEDGRADLKFPAYTVEYGNEDEEDHDITATDGNRRLIGEAFNVAPSYFPGKSRSALKKLDNSGASNVVRVLVYNQDATGNAPGITQDKHAIYHISVLIPELS